METKANLKPDGCLARAMPHEPFFVLLARDPSAPAAIRHWCELRTARSIGDGPRQDAGQISEAFETADQMELWRVSNQGAWNDWEAKRQAKIERLARRIAAASCPRESIDLIWQTYVPQALVALDEFEKWEVEAD